RLSLRVVRPPPRTTPFPSTPLFRSAPGGGRRVARARGSHRGALAKSGGRDRAARTRRSRRTAVGAPGRAVRAGQKARTARPGAPDRKSTRLNSSHVEISYAVFCLKK